MRKKISDYIIMGETLKELATETEIKDVRAVDSQIKVIEAKKTSFLAKLLELDLAIHVLLLFGFGTFLLFFFVISPNLSRQQNLDQLSTVATKEPSTTTENESTEEKTTKKLIRPVYANTEEVDPEQIFSYPASKISLAFTGEPKKEVYGFFPYWMLPVYDKVNISSLTSVGLFALDVDGKGNIQTTDKDGAVSPGWKMWNDPKLPALINKLKKKRIKVDVVIKSFNNTSTEQLVLSDDAQKTFIANCLYLVSSKGLSGINLDFEYVGTPKKEVRSGFTRLVSNLRAQMRREFPNLTLTIDTYVSEAAVPRLVDIQALEESVDAFIVMGYDFHTPNGSAGPIAPMEGEGGYSIIGFLQSYLEKVKSEKIILAVAYYGYDWAIPTTTEKGKTLPYAQLASISQSQKIQWDESAQAPYFKYRDQQTKQERIMYYENPRSLSVKYDYVNQKNLRGIGIWALGYDGLNADLRTLIVEKFSRILQIESQSK